MVSHVDIYTTDEVMVRTVTSRDGTTTYAWIEVFEDGNVRCSLTIFCEPGQEKIIAALMRTLLDMRRQKPKPKRKEVLVFEDEDDDAGRVRFEPA